MSISSATDITGRFFSNMIPPEIGKGELVTGGRIIDPARRQYLKSVKRPNDIDKIAVPVGEDGSFLQADSTMETGLKWVKIAMPTPDEQYKKALEDEVMVQREQIDALVNFLTPQLNSMIEQKNEKMKEERDTKGQQIFFVRVNGVDYTVPYNIEMTVQDVINYIKTTYFIILSPGGCTGLRLIFEGKPLDAQEVISTANIKVDSIVNTRCLASLFTQIVGSRIAGDTAATTVAAAAGKGGGKSRRPNKLKKRSKNTKCSKR